MSKSFLAVFFLSLVMPSSLLAAEPDPLFASTEPLEMTLTGPFETIDRERDKEQEYAGTLSYTDSAGNEIELDAAYQVRGNWRLQPDNCDYSQLWIDLRRSQLPGTLFENQNRLKLVVQCRRRDRYAELVIKEEQAYRVFGELTEYNFDTRLARVTYQDSEDDESRTHLAFFIEHTNRLAERFGMEEVELNSVGLDELEPQQASLVALFMYFLGNTDFSLTQGPPDDECCHNAKLLRNAAGQYVPIPYDFDASGFVDAPYAPLPSAEMGINSSRTRLYRGYCAHNAALPSAISLVQSRRAALEAILAETDYVSARVSSRSLRYLEDYFEILDDERQRTRRLEGRCRG